MIALLHALLVAVPSLSTPSATLAPLREIRVIERMRAGADSRARQATHNDLSSLDPEFRTRLERVIARMTGELGHIVEVVETYRDQERQESLFAQGRSAPGPVVTWTRNSLHTLGRAADIRIDGRSDECAGYRDLRRIAESEGLHTLGARDPGHVEMPRSASNRHYAWAPPARDPGASTLTPGAVMTRIIATGGGPVATATPTVFSRRDRHAEVAEQSDGEYSEPASEARDSTVVVVEPARRRLPNAEERRRAAMAMPVGTSNVASAAAREEGPASLLAAVRADAATGVERPRAAATGRVER